MPHIGFIISLKDKWVTSKIAKDENLGNMLVKDFLPQKELLND